MRLPNAPPGLPHHPAPGLRGNPVLYTNRHAGYFTALLCGIPLSTGFPPAGRGRRAPLGWGPGLSPGLRLGTGAALQS